MSTNNTGIITILIVVVISIILQSVICVSLNMP